MNNPEQAKGAVQWRDGAGRCIISLGILDKLTYVYPDEST
jgi:hypothetical protein